MVVDLYYLDAEARRAPLAFNGHYWLRQQPQ
jgi:hypothetical protein